MWASFRSRISLETIRCRRLRRSQLELCAAGLHPCHNIFGRGVALWRVFSARLLHLSLLVELDWHVGAPVLFIVGPPTSICWAIGKLAESASHPSWTGVALLMVVPPGYARAVGGSGMARRRVVRCRGWGLWGCQGWALTPDLCLLGDTSRPEVNSFGCGQFNRWATPAVLYIHRASKL